MAFHLVGAGIALALIIEAATLMCRMGFHMKSAEIERRHMPRIHHSYIGILFLALNLVAPHEWLFVLGIALVLSDIMHHVLAVPMVGGGR
jgi:hypothetical protein